jgi:hypothetical protein
MHLYSFDLLFAANCKYKKVGKWSDCDLTTGVRSREVTLKKGDPEICPLKKTATKSCVKKTNKKKGKGKGKFKT